MVHKQASQARLASVLTLSWALLASRGLCSYYEKGKLTSGSSYSGTNYQHILVEALQGSGSYAGGTNSNYWSGTGKRPASNWYWPGGATSPTASNATQGKSQSSCFLLHEQC
nr:uncharacterized protein LOC128688117 [Cherax quadricarinatus]